MEIGTFYALLGAALAVMGGGIGSAVGMMWTCQAASGVIKEKPDKFGKLLLMMLIPATNAIYGMITGFVILLQTGVFEAGGLASLSGEQGLIYFALSLPIAIVGLLAALFQAKVAVSGIGLIGKRDEESGRALAMAGMIEIVPIFSLVISLLGIFLITL